MAHEDAAFSSQHSAVNQDQQKNQKPFTTEDRESTRRDETVPLIHSKAGQVNAAEQRVRQLAEALVRKIGEACDELERLAEENPELVGRVTRGSEEHKDAYLRLKARLSPQPAQNRRDLGTPRLSPQPAQNRRDLGTPRLELADAAPRCRWVKQDGTACRSPQMKKHIYCFAHRQMMEARALALSLPAQEDANAIQIGIMRIQKALIEDTISTKKAGLLLYSMQLALQNVGQVTFGQAKVEEPVRETVNEEEAFSKNQEPFTAEGAENAVEIGTSGHRDIGSSKNQRPFTTEGTKGTEEEKDLLRINADQCGFEQRREPVEWRPTADMYRMDTREGMEAYEARFRMKIRPKVVAQPGAALPMRAKNAFAWEPVVPHEHSET